MRPKNLGLAAAAILLLSRPVWAQQRPLLTEDPEAIGAGRILVEAGVDYALDQEYPASGLTGNLWRVPTIGLSFGISSIAEFQLDGGFYNHLAISERIPAPLSGMLTVTGDSTSDVEDLVVGTKIRLKAESARFISMALRFTTRLPNAGNESGLGLDTTDFAMSLLGAKTVRSLRVVGNVGFAILADPTEGTQQNDVFTYGLSFARAVTDSAEIVGEVNGRISTRAGGPYPGTESKGLFTTGARYTRGSYRLDAGLFWGLTAVSPSIGFTGGVTMVFNAFEVP